MSGVVKFEYNGNGVRGDDERQMLNLTDMWRADGSDPNRRPAYWIRGEGSKYVKFIEKTLSMTENHTECFRVVMGGNDAATWAIPKVALAYGMYLSAQFQDHCLGIILSVYRDGGYIAPGREEDFFRRLTEKDAIIERQRLCIEKQFERIKELDSPVLRPCEAKDIRKNVSMVAALRYPLGDVSKLVGFRRVDNELRGRVGFSVGTGRRWESFPRHRLGDVHLALAEMRAEDESLRKSRARHASKTNPESQVVIDFSSRQKPAK